MGLKKMREIILPPKGMAFVTRLRGLSEMEAGYILGMVVEYQGSVKSILEEKITQ